MTEKKFLYAGKYFEELMLLILGVGLVIFFVYEAFFTEDILIMRAVELPPVLSKVLMIVGLSVASGLVVVSTGNLKNRKSKYLIIEDGNLMVPRKFSKIPMVIALSDIDGLERQDHDGTEMLIIKVSHKLTNLTLESTKFISPSDYSEFLLCLDKELSK